MQAAGAAMQVILPCRADSGIVVAVLALAASGEHVAAVASAALRRLGVVCGALGGEGAQSLGVHLICPAVSAPPGPE